MASWEPVDIDPADRDEIGEEDNEWDDVLRNELQRRFEKLKHFNSRLETSSHEEFCDITLKKNDMKKDTIELVANQIYDRITKLFNDSRKRLCIKKGANIVEPIRDYSNFNLDDNGYLTFNYGKEDIYLGNINEGLLSPSKMIDKLRVNRLRSMGFRNITDEDICPCRARYKEAREG